MKKKKKTINIILIFVVLIGIGMVGYAVYDHFETEKKEQVALEKVKKEIAIEKEKQEERDREEEKKIIKKEQKKKEEERKKQEREEKKKREIENKLKKLDPKQGDTIGVLDIPKIDGELPIIEGTDPDSLDKGVGHFTGTVYPTQDNQIVLSGHRDTVFRRIGELDLGDILTVNMEHGSYDYEIVKTHITDADDRTVIVPHDEETLTVTTCYPFRYVGNAPDRYIITAKPVSRN